MAKRVTTVRLASEHFPCEGLTVFRLTGREAISQLFEFELEVVSDDEAGLEVADVAGATASLVFERNGAELRRVHGMIAAVTDRLETEDTYRSYTLRFVPRAWRLSMVQTQEITLDQSPVEVIQRKLERVGLNAPGDVELRLVGDYPKHELVVQYRETDLAFVSRWAEHLGISFFFVHGEQQETLVLTDHQDGFGAVDRHQAMPFQGRGERIDVFEIERHTELVPRAYAVVDYDYEKPQLDLTAVHSLETGYAGGVAEYGSHFKAPEQGRRLAEIRAQERECGSNRFRAQSDLCELDVGSRRELTGHRHLEGQELLLVELRHELVQPVAGYGRDEVKANYGNALWAAPAELTYRPPRRTPRPRIHGILNGIVEPEIAGKRIRISPLDEQGRYAVKFLFDTSPLTERKPSKPIRMAQPFAGERDGMHLPLKAGVEVLMAFLDGDPDRPIIIGAVPNAVNPSPVTSDEPMAHRIQTDAGVLLEFGEV